MEKDGLGHPFFMEQRAWSKAETEDRKPETGERIAGFSDCLNVRTSEYPIRTGIQWQMKD